MRAYAELLTCRREYLLSYFGEGSSSRCDFCDNCERTAIRAPESDSGGNAASKPPLRQPARRDADVEEEPVFPEHTRVFHAEWGLGVVQSIAGDGITILFDTAGEKTLSLRVIRERNLLERAG